MKEKQCCICGHMLRKHVDEGDGWRCHSIGRDGFQCECFLRKDMAEGNIEYYDLDRRIDEFKKTVEDFKNYHTK